MIKVFDDFDLSARNTFRMKVRCRKFIEYDSAKDLETLDFSALPGPVLSIGGGSNLLFSGDFPGTLLHSRIEYVKFFDLGLEKVPVAVGAGVCFDFLCAKMCAEDLWGLENLSLIPGDAGAAAVQNIGAYGVEFKDIMTGVSCYDTVLKQKCSFKREECGYGYRESIFKKPENKGRYIITGVMLELSRKPEPRLDYAPLKAAFEGRTPQSPQEVRDAVIAIRNSKLPDPAVTGSAGSFFKNPVVSPEKYAEIAASAAPDPVPHFDLPDGSVKIPAAWMIDRCKLKGHRCGGAQVYEKQPLVIVNASGEASPEEVLKLKDEVIARVEEQFGVQLHCEVEQI